MKKITILTTVAAFSLAFASSQGCDDGTGGTGATGGGGGSSTSTSTSTSSGDSGTNPPPPTLGKQIERMGRPAINTALNHAFDSDSTAKGMAKDAWNAEGDESKWGTSFAKEVENNLAIIDALDTVCGNQFGADLNPADRYSAVAGILTNDKLWVKLDTGSCTQYLAVEATAAGLPLGTDCGGRKLDYDVIDLSYSALAAGALSGVSDGIDADADTKGTTFPFLAAPH